MDLEKYGLKPKKNWDGKKVRAPNGSYGWPDKYGRIWVPSGPSNKGKGEGGAHGKPHWDVQYPDGGHENIEPGGRIRGRIR